MGRGSRSDSGWKNFEEVTAATVLAYRAVTLVGGKIQHAIAGEGSKVAGWTQEPTTSADPDLWAVKLRTNGAGTVTATVSVAVAVDDLLYCAAAGKLTNVANGDAVAVALEAGSADGAEIEVLPIGTLSTTPFPFNVLPLSGDAITAAEFAASGLTLGMIAQDSLGNRYRLILSDNVNGPDALGYPMGIRTAGVSEFDLSDDLAASTEHQIRGLSANLFSGTDVYGWVLIEGSLQTALNGAGMTVTTDGNVAQGDSLYWGADGKLYGIVPTATMTDHTFCGASARADSGTNLTAAQFNGNALNSHGVA
jgi:hypothetical protein